MKFISVINTATAKSMIVNMDKILLFGPMNDKSVLDTGDKLGALCVEDSIESIIQKLGSDFDYFIELHAWAPPKVKKFNKNKNEDGMEGSELVTFVNILNVSAVGVSKENQLIINFGPTIGDVIFTDDPEYVLPLFN